MDTWLPASGMNEWHQFGKHVDSSLEATLKGGANRRLHIMATVKVSTAAERFGTVEKGGTKSQYIKNCRVGKVTQLRQELQLFKRQFNGGSEEEKIQSGSTMCHAQKGALDSPKSECQK